MSAHDCREITPGCYRCELNHDEIAANEAEDRADAQMAWLAYRDADLADNPTRYAKPRKRDFIAGFFSGRRY